MFHKELVSSDKFIDMPASTQLLFFHLGMNADDEGFVSSPKRIQRMVGCGSDDLKILLAKNFIVGFDSGVVVITDWNKHNQLRKDRFSPTLHVEEKAQLQLVDFEQCQPIGNQMATMGKPSIGKVSIIKESPQLRCGVPHSNNKTERQEKFDKFWNFYSYKKEKKKAEANFMKLTEKQLTEVSQKVSQYVNNTYTDGTFPSRMYPARYLNPKNELWNDEVVTVSTTGAESEY